MDGPRQRRAVSIPVPDGIMRTMIERAKGEWGDRAVAEREDGSFTVRIWAGGKRIWDDGTEPVATFRAAWDAPTAGVSTIDELRWDPEQGSSEAEVRAVIDALAGYSVG